MLFLRSQSDYHLKPNVSSTSDQIFLENSICLYSSLEDQCRHCRVFSCRSRAMVLYGNSITIAEILSAFGCSWTTDVVCRQLKSLRLPTNLVEFIDCVFATRFAYMHFPTNQGFHTDMKSVLWTFEANKTFCPVNFLTCWTWFLTPRCDKPIVMIMGHPSRKPAWQGGIDPLAC